MTILIEAGIKSALAAIEGQRGALQAKIDRQTQEAIAEQGAEDKEQEAEEETLVAQMSAAADAARQKAIAEGVEDEDAIEAAAEAAADAIALASPNFGRGAYAARSPYLISREQRVALKLLETRQKHLKQFQTWIERDPEFLRLLDSGINNRVRAAQRRQTIISVGVGIVSLIAGWLLSAISPALAFAHLLGH